MTDRKSNPLVIFHQQLERQAPGFSAALPPDVTVERFCRVVTTAVQKDLSLLDVAIGQPEERLSFWNACMDAANDGLLPDRREGAIVVYSTNVAKKAEKPAWRRLAQWNPMVAGLLKQLYNTGKVFSVTPAVVYKNDWFHFVRGDAEAIEHRPNFDDPLYGLEDLNAIRGVYAIAHLSNARIEREFMTRAQVEQIRERSRTKDSPAWRDWPCEMAKAKAIRRLRKRLPISQERLWTPDEDEIERLPPNLAAPHASGSLDVSAELSNRIRESELMAELLPPSARQEGDGLPSDTEPNDSP